MWKGSGIMLGLISGLEVYLVLHSEDGAGLGWLTIIL